MPFIMSGGIPSLVYDAVPIFTHFLITAAPAKRSVLWNVSFRANTRNTHTHIQAA